MSDRWEYFKKVAHKVLTSTGEDRQVYAKIAAKLSIELVDFLVHNPQFFDEWESLRHSVVPYVDSHFDYIEEVARDHFLRVYVSQIGNPNPTDFSIVFRPKPSGLQVGRICEVKYGNRMIVYFLKSHQYGPQTSSQPIGSHSINLREVFIYKLLELTGLGPSEVHYIVPTHGSKITLYIATKSIDGFVPLKKIRRSNTTGNEFYRPFIEIIFFSTSFMLSDVCGRLHNNWENYGVRSDGSTIHSVIIDFHANQDNFIPEDLDYFCLRKKKHSTESNLILESTLKRPKEEKLFVVKEAMDKWKLYKSIDDALLFTNNFQKQYEKDLKTKDLISEYANACKRNITTILQELGDKLL